MSTASAASAPTPATMAASLIQPASPTKGSVTASNSTTISMSSTRSTTTVESAALILTRPPNPIATARAGSPRRKRNTLLTR